MAITASGMFGLTLEKMFKKTQDADLETDAEMYVLMTTDTYAPNFDTHDFRADVTNEVSGGGYTAGGQVAVGATLTVGSPAVGQIKYDWTTDPAWASSTITSAMAGIIYFTSGAAATDQLVYLADFVTAASTNNGTFTIQIDANGWFYFDYTP